MNIKGREGESDAESECDGDDSESMKEPAERSLVKMKKTKKH